MYEVDPSLRPPDVNGDVIPSADGHPLELKVDSSLEIDTPSVVSLFCDMGPLDTRI